MAEANKSSIGVRVRPNADGFIRNLRAELASKKYTFYVDVRARTNLATDDVRVWARTTLKNVEAKVNVGASMVKATGDVATWRRRQRAIETVIPVRANMAPANREVELWRVAAGRDLEIKVKANVSGKLTEIERVRKAAEKDARMTIRGDTSKVRNDIKQGLDAAGQGQLFSVQVDADTKKARYQIGELFNEVKGEQLEMGLDLDTTAAHTKLGEVKTAAKELSPTAKVHLETAEYRRDMAKLKLEAMRKKLTVDVEAKVTAGDNFGKKLSNLEKMMGSFTIIRSMDLGPINLGKPTGLVGTMTTITALAGLVPGLVTGLSALSDAFVRLAGAASVAPGALAAFGVSLGTAATASFGFTAALDALFKVWTEPTDKIERTQRNTIKWTNDLNKALTNEKQAQRAVADARRDATNELRNLNNELRGSMLNEAQAILDLQRAKDRMAQGDFENATEATQAQLDVAQAYQNVIDVRERNAQLAQKASQKQQQGVEESDQVTQALEQQARATEAVALAMQSLSMANPMGAQSLFEDAMNRLSPKAQDAVNAIKSLREEITGFQRGLQDTMFNGVADQILGTFKNLAPTIMPGMQAISQALNDNILAVFNSINSSDGKSIIERILGGTAEAQRALTALIDPLVRGFGTLIAAGTEHLPQVVNLITQLADRFAVFIEKADKDGSLSKFMDNGIKAFGQLAEIGINLVKIINDFSNGFRGAFNQDLLTTMVKITENWHKFLSSAEGQKKINEYIQTAKDIWEKWQPVLSDLPGIFEKVSNVAQGFLKAFLPILNTVSEVLERAPWLVEAFAAVWIGGKVASAGMAIFKFGELIVGVGKGVGGLATGLVGFMKSVGPYLPVIGQWLAAKAGFGPTGGLPPFLPGDKGTPQGAPVGAGGTDGGGGKGGNAPKPQGKLGKLGSALGKVGGIIGKAFTPLAVAAMGYDIYSQMSAANDAYGQWQEARNAAKDEATKRQIDKAIYDSLGITIPDSGKYPILGPNDFRGFAAPPDSMAPLYENGFEVKDGKIVQKGTGQEMYLLDSYKRGGLTPWARDKGKAAVLHGQEFVIPADAVQFYGQDFMEAIQKRKLPPLKFSGGGEVYDPMTGQWVPAPAEQPHMPNQDGGGMVPGLLGDAMSGVSSVLNNVPAPDAGTPGVGTGPLPGPLPLPPGAIPTPMDAPAVNPATTPLKTNIGGMDVNLGNIPAGWPGGQAPVGLGGGPDGFDIRNFGIGPGPAGSTPSDWAKWGLDFTSGFVTNMGGALLRGFLGIFGLEGALNNTYIQNALGLGMHFLDAGKDKKAQAPGAQDMNNYAGNLINGYYNMPMNPAYPGVPGSLPAGMQGYFPGYGQQFMPGVPMMGPNIGLPGLPGMPGFIPGGTELPVGNAAGSEAGLQRDTIAGRRALSAAFPMLQEIGGVRADKLKWHPNGLALDAMIPTELRGTQQGAALGNTITQFALQNAGSLGVNHVIWQGKIYYPNGNVEQMNLTGNQTQDHFDHPHIAFNGAGMPDANTKYYAPASGIVQYTYDRNGFPVAAMGGMMPGMLPGAGLPNGTSFTPTDSPVTPSNSPLGGIGTGAFDYQLGKFGGLTSPGITGGRGAYGAGKSGSSTPTPASSGLRDKAKAAFLAAGYTPDQWATIDALINQISGWNPNKLNTDSRGGGTRLGIGQFTTSTQETYGIKDERDGEKQFAVLMKLLKDSYPSDFNEVKRLVNFWQGFSRGGAVWGAGSATSDSIPALLSNGEHVLTADEVKALGGQDGVYRLRAAIKGYAYGGAVQGVIVPQPPPIPPRPPMWPPTNTAQPKQIPAQKKVEPTPTPVPAAPKPTPIEQMPSLPGVQPGGAPTISPTPTGPEVPASGPQGSATTDQPSTSIMNPGPGAESYMHLHPAARKGIASGMAVAGQLAQMAAMAAIGGGMGAGAGAAMGAAAAGAGGGGGGGMGLPTGVTIQGLFQQGGKIMEDAANIGASFLVGNITGGTTENPYGVTQMPNKPTGGTKIYDASTSIGSIHTADLDEYYRRENRRQAQRAQSGLGQWGNR